MSLPWTDLAAAGTVAVATAGALTFATDELPRRRRRSAREHAREQERVERRQHIDHVDWDDLPLIDADWDFDR